MIARLQRTPSGNWMLESVWSRDGEMHTDTVVRPNRAGIDLVVRDLTSEYRPVKPGSQLSSDGVLIRAVDCPNCGAVSPEICRYRRGEGVPNSLYCQERRELAFSPD